MKFITCHNLVKFSVSAACFGIFVALTVKQCSSFMKEPTGSTLTREYVEAFPFPAITICDTHFQNALAFEELNFPRPPLGTLHLKEVLTNPEHLIEKLTLFGHDVVPNLWRYFFTLDKVIHHLATLPKKESAPNVRCKIGNVNCVRIMPSYDVVIPLNTSHQEVEVEVQAGKWKSRFYASSIDSKLHLCHTLVPNVTVGFANIGANVVSMLWKHDYAISSNYRTLYIHDRNEDVLLNSFAIDAVASTVVESHKKKIQIIPKLVNHPKHSAVHPCQEEENYGENQCNVQWGWHNKIKIMKEYYGSNFTCVPPGVWDMPEVNPMPVCQHFEAERSNNNTLGYTEIIKEISYKNRNRPLMAAPPLGVYKSTSPCLRRCQLYTYTIVEEFVSAYDSDIGESDIYLYFASPVVETWTEFLLISPLDLMSLVGGNVGLLLGMSLLSIILLVLELVHLGFKGDIISKLK